MFQAPDRETQEFLNTEKGRYMQLRRLELQTICKYHKITFDPKETSGQKLVEKLMAEDISCPTREQIEEMRASFSPQEQPKPSDAELTGLQQLIALKKHAKTLGIKYTNKTTKEELLELIEEAENANAA